MASTISVGFISRLAVTQTFTGEVDASDNTILVTGLDENSTLTSATTPPVTKQAAFTLTLSSGSGSIDLTALPGLTADETVDGTGLKVQLLKLKAASGNANDITVAKGASNGYGLGASGTTFTDIVPPGSSSYRYMPEINPDIASGARILDVTGTGAQTIDVHVVMG